MPGVPCIYYGSEWGAKGKKENGDNALRQSFEAPIENELTELISKLSKAHMESKALCYGSFESVLLTNKQAIFQRKFEDERVLVAINIDDSSFTAHFDAQCGMAIDLITDEVHDFDCVEAGLPATLISSALESPPCPLPKIVLAPQGLAPIPQEHSFSVGLTQGCWHNSRQYLQAGQRH